MKKIGTLYTPYGTKFGAPKQGGMVNSDQSKILLSSEYGPDSLRGLKEGSFIWVLWEFHQCEGKAKSLVRPPKLGGNEKMGVFGCRSPFRPNNIGMSLLRFEKSALEKGQVVLIVSGADMVTETPVLDIKPYHPVADAPWSDFDTPWFLENENKKMKVAFENEVPFEGKLKELVEDALSLDPRPGYHDDPDRTYSNIIYGAEITWKAEGDTITVLNWRKTND